ncbi:transcription factor SPEECHLESS [Vitis riparia]|uniref:Speechless n=1 Tax=Vitis riparia TaxID=96939 RepID=A0A0N7B3L9_VITRI|nr:transcription factor SPEECHLESS [Vitis riparia]AKA36603.1 speechless [Vitis riparia]AKA36605.1 speechless [Vitis riparia]
MGDSLSDFFEEPEFGGETSLTGVASPDDLDLFSIFESLEGVSEVPPLEETVLGSKEGEETARLVSQKSTSSSALQESETELEASPKRKRPRLAAPTSSEEGNPDGQQRVSHITVERNRRKQMNEHLSVLRSLMPCFYVKRGDQASIIGGVVDYIKELQQVLRSLEAKKQRKVYSEVLSPRVVSSPRPPPISPRKPPLSPRISLPISPRTPQPTSPYKPVRLQQGYLSPTIAPSLEPSPSSSTSSNDNANELIVNSKSAIADVEVKYSCPNVVLKTKSSRIPGQAVKIISALEDLSLEILHVSISSIDETMLNSFTIKFGIECQLSAEELAHQVQQTFC